MNDKRRKVFIAINIDDRTKEHIESKLEKISPSIDSVKRISAENYHITILYVGFISDEELAKICKKTKEVLKSKEEFDFLLDSFAWSPKEENPKMLWIMGEKNNELVDLKYSIENALNESSCQVRRRDFKPHINLGRIVKKRIEPGDQFEKIQERININIPVSSVEIMESLEEKGKRKHYVLESIALS